jgi:membrane-associated protein
MKKYFGYILGVGIIVVAAYLLNSQFDLNKILEAGSLIVLAVILFAETGLLIGFFLPGDTLLFAAGFFAAQGRIHLGMTLLLLFIGTTLGNMLGYEIGRRSGPRIFKSDEALLFKPENIIRAEDFYRRHGGKTILIARFVPIVRTIAPLMAGIGKMKYRVFTFYNLIGGALWVGAVTMIGYWAGKVLGKFFNIDKYILPVVGLATLFTIVVSFWQVWREPKSREHLKKSVSKHWQNIRSRFKK